MSLDLLRYVRDHRPTEGALLGWAAERRLVGNYHVLRKGGVLQVADGTVSIVPERCTDDGTGVRCGNCLYWLDRNRIDIF
jgi:hypothetical protein